MKKLLLAISLCAATVAGAQNQPTSECDTVLSVKNVNRVVVVENPDGLRVNIEGVESDPEFKTSFTHSYNEGAVVKTHQEFKMPFHLRHNAMTVDLLSEIQFGFVTPVGADDELNDVKMGKSYEIALPDLISAKLHNGPSRFGVGFGLDWRNYRMTANNAFRLNDQGAVCVEPYPADVNGRFSRLKIFSLDFSLFYSYRSNIKAIANSNLRFKLATVFKYNTHGSLKTVWTADDGSKRTFTSNHIGQRKFTMDFTLTVGFAPYMGIYLKYSPMDVLADGRGPSFRTFSTGLAFNF